MKTVKIKNNFNTMYQTTIGKILINTTIDKWCWGFGIQILTDAPCVVINFLCFEIEIG